MSSRVPNLLATAVRSAVPDVAARLPADARKCPVLPENARDTRNAQNEPNPNVQAPRKARGFAPGPPTTDAMPENARLCPEMPGPTSNMQNEPKPLTQRQLAAIDLLFAGVRYADVCRQLNIDDKTLYRWRSCPAFIAEVNERKEERALARALKLGLIGRR